MPVAKELNRLTYMSIEKKWVGVMLLITNKPEIQVIFLGVGDAISSHDFSECLEVLYDVDMISTVKIMLEVLYDIRAAIINVTQ